MSKLPISRVKIPSGTTPLVIVLLSKKLVTLSDRSNDFISKLLPQVFSELSAGQTIHVLVAVVDRISRPLRLLQDARLRSLHPQQSFEGISLWAMDSGQTMPNLWTDRDTSKIEATKPKQIPGSFIEIQDSRQSYVLDSHEMRSTIRLGLANTTFENGRLSTCFVQQWTVGVNNSELDTHMIFNRQRDLPSCTIVLPRLGSPKMGKQINVPVLKPLTFPQIVSEAQGNVIRTLQGARDPSKTEPASAALERSIADFHSSGYAKSPYEVWARVVNREYWPAVAGQLLLVASRVSPYALVRYVKVVSGGGGYNARQGLLALDPEPVFPEEPQADFDAFEQRLLGSRDEIFASAIRPGDVIQFYAVLSPDSQSIRYDRSLLENQENEQHLFSEMRVVDGSPSLSFGSIQPSSKTTDTESSKAVVDGLQCLILKHFGALSESGLWSKVEIVTKPGQDPIGALPLGTWSKTKLPPFSIYLAQRRGSPLANIRRAGWPCTDPKIHTPIVNRFVKTPH